MKASEIISKLTELINEHGDLEVAIGALAPENKTQSIGLSFLGKTFCIEGLLDDEVERGKVALVDLTDIWLNIKNGDFARGVTMVLTDLMTPLEEEEEEEEVLNLATTNKPWA